MDLDAARRHLERLVELRRTASYTNSRSELDIRSTLIEPLLRDVLGWDTSDVDEYSRERYSRGSGVVDSVCLVAGVPVMYLEAKRLGVIPTVEELRRSRKFYAPRDEQALRYARRRADMTPNERWTVLTNFDRLRLDEATTEERVLAFESPEDMLGRFDDLMLLSKEWVLSGFLKRAASRRRKPDVDAEFRETLDVWRLRLAQDIYERHGTVLTRPDGTIDLGRAQRLFSGCWTV